jgi:WD40 repeat protein
VQDVAFLPDGRHVVSISVDKTLRVWDSVTGKERHRVELPDRGRVLAVTPDGRHVLTGCSKNRPEDPGPYDFNIRLWQLPLLPKGTEPGPAP